MVGALGNGTPLPASDGGSARRLPNRGSPGGSPSPIHNARSLLIAAVCAALATGGLGGCITLPTREARADTEKGADFRPLMRPAAAGAAIRPGDSTRAQVLIQLGEPLSLPGRDDPSLAVYKFTTLAGRQYWLVGVGNTAPAGMAETYTDHYLFLRYGPGDVLADDATFDGWDGWDIALEKFALATARHRPPAATTGPATGPAGPVH